MGSNRERSNIATFLSIYLGIHWNPRNLYFPKQTRRKQKSFLFLSPSRATTYFISIVGRTTTI